MRTITSLEAFKKTELKVNKLSTNDNIDIFPGEFVLIFNEQQTKWFEEKFRNRSTRIVDVVQALLVHDFPLKKEEDHNNHSDFDLPNDYFDYSSSYSLAASGLCKGRVIYNEEIKPVNKNIIFTDDYNTPSFDYQEGFVTLGDNNLQVYKTPDFEITDTFLTYYRYPKPIDIKGYIKVDGTESVNADPELSEHYVDEIIDRCVLEIQRAYENGDGFQLSKDRDLDNDE